MGREFYVKAIGTDLIKTYPNMSLEAAKAALKDLYDTTLANHNGGSWFDETVIEDDCMEFVITGEEFYQTAWVEEVNYEVGYKKTIEEIRRLTREADTYANAYEYELANCGVYDVTAEIRSLLDKLETELDEDKTPTSDESEISTTIPERISIDEVRRGLTDGDIIIGAVDGEVVAEIGEYWFYFCEEDAGVTPSAHIDTTPFEEDVRMIHAAINAEPVNGMTEEEASECLYYKAVLRERAVERDKCALARCSGKLVHVTDRENLDACYKYLNWTDSKKNPYDMTDSEVRAAFKELDECYPGIALVKQAGYDAPVPQDKQTGKIILYK